MYNSTIQTQDMIITNTGDQTLEISNVLSYNDNQVPNSIDVYVSLTQTAPNCGTDANFSASIDKTSLQPGEEALFDEFSMNTQEINQQQIRILWMCGIKWIFKS